MGFGLKVRKIPRPEADRMVDSAATTLKLDALMDRFPRELSGGQRQRVAIGRAIVGNPEVFLFDEPLSNLDAELRVHMRAEIAALHRRLGNTMVYVTHDQIEAMTLADRIVVLRDGRIEQVGTPRDLYARPVNVFVAQFIGSPRMNVLPAAPLSAQFAAKGLSLTGADRVGLRPEHLRVEKPGQGVLQGQVILSEYTGSGCLLHVALDHAETVLVQHDGEDAPAIDSRIGLSVQAAHLHRFDAEGLAIRPS
jgi:ABC-type sugar transport system ATPase subunit